MDRFFAAIHGDFVTLSPEDAHHLTRVLRRKAGDALEIVSEGALYEAKILSLDPLKIAIVSQKERQSELSHELYLAFSLLKGGHDEWVLQKGTELGAKGFIPFISSRTVIRLEGKEREKRRLRFEKILEGAAMQSKRLEVPSLSPVLDFRDLLSLPHERKLFAYEELSGGSFNLPRALSDLPKRTLAVVGPEGGFDPKEVTMAKEAGFLPISLGKRILRAETASLYLASVFAYLSEGGDDGAL